MATATTTNDAFIKRRWKSILSRPSSAGQTVQCPFATLLIWANGSRKFSLTVKSSLLQWFKDVYREKRSLKSTSIHPMGFYVKSSMVDFSGNAKIKTSLTLMNLSLKHLSVRQKWSGRLHAWEEEGEGWGGEEPSAIILSSTSQSVVLERERRASIVSIPHSISEAAACQLYCG